MTGEKWKRLLSSHVAGLLVSADAELSRALAPGGAKTRKKRPIGRLKRALQTCVGALASAAGYCRTLFLYEGVLLHLMQATGGAPVAEMRWMPFIDEVEGMIAALQRVLEEVPGGIGAIAALEKELSALPAKMPESLPPRPDRLCPTVLDRFRALGWWSEWLMIHLSQLAERMMEAPYTEELGPELIESMCAGDYLPDMFQEMLESANIVYEHFDQLAEQAAPLLHEGDEVCQEALMNAICGLMTVNRILGNFTYYCGFLKRGNEAAFSAQSSRSDLSVDEYDDFNDYFVGSMMRDAESRQDLLRSKLNCAARELDEVLDALQFRT